MQMPDSQTLVLVIAAMVAGVVLFRLYLVLGRRTGAEPAPPAPRKLPQPVESPPAAPAAGGLIDIQLADRNFDAPAFLKGARAAYETIIQAFERGDRAALVPLLSPDVLAAFESGIAARGGAIDNSFTRLGDAHIAGATLEARHAEITVAFTAAFASAEGAREVTDVWTFARDLSSGDPNWTLVATAGDLP